MLPTDSKSQFRARLLRPRGSDSDNAWAFIILPFEVSDTLPRRGRTTAAIVMNGHTFEALLEPDGQKSHWLRIDEPILQSANVSIGEEVAFKISALAQEPDPQIPDDFSKALEASPKAQSTWAATTTIARVDWIHWITSAKQAKTRTKRINDACQMLASGKKRVYCFDPSGFYSKALSAPNAAD